jgi:hypothetical protein
MSDLVKGLYETPLYYGDGEASALGEVAADEITRLTARVAELEGQHKGLVIQNALLRQRPDLPVDRIPAARDVEALTARVAQMEAVVERVYQSSNQRHIIEMTRAALSPSRRSPANDT